MNKTLIAVAALAISTAAIARDQIQIVGSSTVYPFATVVAETFGKMGTYKAPVIESTGSGGGLKLFCKGLGVDTPDITNSSRQIKNSEVELCKKNGVTPVERMIGYDGIAFANSKDGVKLSVTKEQLFKAISKVVLIDGKWVENPYNKWSDISKDLPDQNIDILAPPPTSGTRDAFVELVMHKTCKKDYKMGKKGPDGYKTLCSSLREDGHVTEVGENDNVVIMKLTAEKTRFGIFGFSFLDNNRDKVQGATVNGVDVDFDTIADGSYPISRPLFYYIKQEHIGKIPGIEAYDELFKKMAQPEGKLEELGLITIGK